MINIYFFLFLYFAEDPTRVLPHDIDVPNSVLKFMVDLFSIPSLIELFYLNDIKVLLDIVVRQLSDLLPGEKVHIFFFYVLPLIICCMIFRMISRLCMLEKLFLLWYRLSSTDLKCKLKLRKCWNVNIV